MRGKAGEDDADEPCAGGPCGQRACDAAAESLPERRGAGATPGAVQPRCDQVLAAEGDELGRRAHRLHDLVGQLGADGSRPAGGGSPDSSAEGRYGDHDRLAGEQDGSGDGVEQSGDRGSEEDARAQVDRDRRAPGDGLRHVLGVGHESAEQRARRPGGGRVRAGARRAQTVGDQRLDRVVQPQTEPGERLQGDAVNSQPLHVAGDPASQRKRLHRADGDRQLEHRRSLRGPGEQPARGGEETDRARRRERSRPGGRSQVATRRRSGRPAEAQGARPPVLRPPHLRDSGRVAAAAPPRPA